ncbi:MAG TPA: DUF1801 domain-containing protein [Flavisolibacter sp.]
MAKTKTAPTGEDVGAFIRRAAKGQKLEDSFRLVELFSELTGQEPYMWGPSIVGFGNYHYRYASGHEGDAPIAAFSPRRDSMVIYVDVEFPEKEPLLEQLGKHKAFKSCVYFKKLEDIDVGVLKKLVKASMRHTKKLYPGSK